MRLLSVSERAKQLFGAQGEKAVADTIEEGESDFGQLSLFPETEEDAAPQIKGRGARKKGRIKVSEKSLKTHREATMLDRVHAAMLLQASARPLPLERF